MSLTAEYVQPDKHNVLRVGASQVMLDSVLAAWSQGHSPESIRSQYRSLTLEEVYGAITWSLAHQNEVNAYLKQQDQIWNKWRQRSESTPSPLRDRLRAAKAQANCQ